MSRHRPVRDLEIAQQQQLEGLMVKRRNRPFGLSVVAGAASILLADLVMYLAAHVHIIWRW